MEKVQVKLYLSSEVAEALRVAAARRGGQGAQSAIAEEILREGLGVIMIEAKALMIQGVQDALDRHLTNGYLVFGSDGSGGAWYGQAGVGESDDIEIALRPDAEAPELVADAIERMARQQRGGE